jgi:hypothetical protein
MEDRRVDKIVDGAKVPVSMKDLHEGDIFTLTDVDESGSLHPDAIEDGTQKYIAKGEPFITFGNEDGVWAISGEKFNE